MVAVRAAVASTSAAGRDRGGVTPGSSGLLRSLRRSRSLCRLICGPCAPEQRRGGAASEVGGEVGGASRDASPAISPAVSPALRRSGGRSERVAAWQSYRQPPLTPPSSFDGGQAGGGEHGGRPTRAVSISELQRSSHDSDRESNYSGAGGSPLVQVQLVRTSHAYHYCVHLTLTLT